MTALELYKFIEKNKIEYDWFIDKHEQLNVYIVLEAELFDEFCELLGDFVFNDDEGVECILKYKYMIIPMGEICNKNGLSLEDIFEGMPTIPF